MRFLGIGIGHHGHQAMSSDNIDDMRCDSDTEDPSDVEDNGYKNGEKEAFDDVEDEDEDEDGDESADSQGSFDEEDEDDIMIGYDDL